MRALSGFVGSLAIVVSLPGIAAGALSATDGIELAVIARVVADHGALPIAFEPNRGQADRAVRFLARGPGYGLFLTPTEALLSLRSSTEAAPTQPNALIRMRLAGANPKPQVSGVDRLPGTSNYFVGNDPARWLSAVPNYAKVRYADVYPGIDLVYYGNQRQLEYDLIVAPGADAKRIVLDFKGVKKLALDAEGNLMLATAIGNVVQHKPVVYQDIDGVRQILYGRYRLLGDRRAGIEVPRYDTTRQLIIDPTLAYSTYLGGAVYDEARGIAVDGSGSAYVTGITNGSFPTTPGAYRTAASGGSDVFVTKLNATGTALVYSTYLGGSLGDFAGGIAVDGAGNAYVAGETGGNFPTTPGAYQVTFGGPVDAFVTKLNATGTALMYSTYLGGGNSDRAAGIAVDGSGSAYVTGNTSGDFPTTPGAYQITFAGIGSTDAFVTKLNATGTALVYSTYLGGTGNDGASGIAIDKAGNAYVAGGTSGSFPTTPSALQATFAGGNSDAFVTKLNASGTALLYSTYLGGNLRDFAQGIAIDDAGNAFVTGATEGNFPTTPGAFQTSVVGWFDAFVTKLNATGTALVYSTCIGGDRDDVGSGIAVDRGGRAYVTGYTWGNFPTTPGAYQTSFAGGTTDAFVTTLNATGMALAYSTYLGGDGTDQAAGIALDGSGNAYVTGQTSGSFPATPGAFQTTIGGSQDTFVTKLANLLPSAAEIPTVSEWALFVLSAVLALCSAATLRYRKLH